MSDESAWSPCAAVDQALLELLGSTGTGLWDYDLTSGQVRCNRAVADILGRAADLGSDSAEAWLEWLHPEDAPLVRARLRQALNTDDAIDLSARVQRPDETQPWVRLHGRVIRRDQAGRPLQVVGTLRALSEHEALQAQLAASEERLRLVTATITEVFWIADVDLKATYYVSPAYERIWQRPVTELYANPASFLEAIHPDDRSAVFATLARKGEAQPFDHEYRICLPDGSERWIWDRGFPVVEPDGVASRYVGLAQDITERRQAQAEILRLNAELEQRVAGRTAELTALTEALRHSQADLERAQAVARLGSWRLDRRNDRLTWSAETYRLFGVPPDQPLTYQSFLSLVHPADRAEVERGWQAALEGAPYDIEHRLLVDDQVRWVRERAELDRDAKGEIRGAFGTVQDITERRQAEMALRASEERLRLLIEHAPAALAMFDREMRYLAVSRRWRLDYGLIDREVIGQSHYGIFPEIPERWRQAHGRALAGEVVEAEEDYFERADGRAQWLRWMLRPWYDAEGAIGGVVVFSEDITQRKQADLCLAQERELLQRIFDHIPILLTLWDPSLDRFRLNRHAERVLGWTTAEANSGDFLKLVYPDSDYRAQVIDYICSLQTGWREWLSATKDGQQVPIDWANLRLSDDTLLGIGVDLRERKAAEQALRLAEERARLALKAGRMGTWDRRLPDGVVLWNDEYYRMLGYRPGEVTPGFQALMERIHPEDRATLEATYRAHMKVGGNFSDELRILWPNGSLRWLQLQGRIELAPSGQPTRIYGVVIDITERRQAEEALRASDQRKSEFLAILAHELRNPLASIRHAVDILKLTSLANQAQVRACDLIDRQLRHLVRLIDDLMDISRIDRGTLELCREAIELGPLLEQVCEAVRPQIRAAGHQLDVATPSSPIRLYADPVRLTQVLRNLLDNACKYTPSGGRIELSAERTEYEVILRVRDSGIGIAEDDLEHVFDLFGRVSRPTEPFHGGLGIGLALTRHLVELHGGRIEALSEGPGKGAELRVHLPVKAQPPDETPESLGAASPAGMPPCHVLVVDDDPDIIDSLSLLLSLHGYRVSQAENGLTALETVDRERPDAVLLDLGIPGINGYETCERLRARPDGSALRIIALSGWGQEEAKSRSRAAGFDAHLVKPVETAALLRLLGELGGHSSLRGDGGP